MIKTELILKAMDGYNYPSLPDKVQIHIPNAESHLRGGLDFMVRKFSGNPSAKAVWSESNYRPIVDWMENNNGKGLLMSGACGLGKTLIGSFILPLLINDACNKIVNCCDAQEMNVRADELMGYHLLSIDDVGVEGLANIYGNKRMLFPELVDAAEKKGRLLIITTNLDVLELSQKYGERTIDRLRAITKFVPFSGNSLRG